MKAGLLAGGIFALGAAVFLLVEPVPQDPAYHDFADARAFFGVPNFLNVVSNLAFLAAGAAGMAWTLRFAHDRARFADAGEEWPALAAFVGVLFLAFASAYYHLFPVNETLAADRLAIAIVAMAILSMAVGERAGPAWGARLLPAFLVAGAASVAVWITTEKAGAGDLRLYGLVQFATPLVILALFALFPARYTGSGYWLAMLGALALGKGFELADREIWRLTGEALSGHTLKHLVSGAGLFLLALHIRNRRAVAPGPAAGR